MDYISDIWGITLQDFGSHLNLVLEQAINLLGSECTSWLTFVDGGLNVSLVFIQSFCVRFESAPLVCHLVANLKPGCDLTKWFSLYNFALQCLIGSVHRPHRSCTRTL